MNFKYKCIWIIESKIKQGLIQTNWKPCLGFKDIPAVYLTRRFARNAAKQMFNSNAYNFIGNRFKPYVFYRVKKYVSK